eukprot:UN25154
MYIIPAVFILGGNCAILTYDPTNSMWYTIMLIVDSSITPLFAVTETSLFLKITVEKYFFDVRSNTRVQYSALLVSLGLF